MTEGRKEQHEPRISVVLPVYEEAETVQRLIPEIVERLDQEGETFEIIAVDDGSLDETPDVLKALKRQHPQHLRVVRHLYNKGNGASLRTGTRVAGGEVVVYMDADGQHSPNDIPKLIAKIPPYDLVIGARTKNYQSSWHRRAANNFYNRFASWLSGTEVKDLTSGFRALRRAVAIHFLPLYPSGFSSPTTVTMSFLKAGYNVTFVPIDVGTRRAGRSKINLWRDGSNFVLIILRMIMLYDPLRIFLPTGIILVLLGFLTWIAGLIQAERLVLPNSSLFLFIAALLTLLLGLVAGQIASSRVYYHGDETILVDDQPQ